MPAALTPNTNTLNSGAYLSGTEFLKRKDWRTITDLVSDSGARGYASSAALAADANLAALLLDASGMFEAACTAGQRYAPSDIANMLALAGATKPATVPNAGQGLIYRLLADLTEAMCWERRPDKGPVPERLLWVQGFLARLADGEDVLPFAETQAAGVAKDVIDDPEDVRDRRLTGVIAARLFGRRLNRYRQQPAD